MRFVVAIAIALGLGGCGNSLAHVSCSATADCVAPAMSLAASHVECCGGSCVLSSVGCDSGWRYLTVEPGYGECVSVAVCAPLDMSLPDLSSSCLDC
jgi:hypothetical protein